MPPLRCAYCHDTAIKDTRPCKRCGALLHYDCWQTLAECPTLGCAKAVEFSSKPVTTRRTVLLAAAGSFLLIGASFGIMLGYRLDPEVIAPHPEPPPTSVVEPLVLGPLAEELPSPGRANLAHVRVGQRYHYRLESAGPEMRMVWEVASVGENEVNYTTTTLTSGQPLGPANLQRWAIPLAIAPPLYSDFGGPPTETIEAAGRTWECWITDYAGIRTWTPKANDLPTFPSYVKQMKGDTVTHELMRIEGP